jgi:hypothetical protein
MNEQTIECCVFEERNLMRPTAVDLKFTTDVFFKKVAEGETMTPKFYYARYKASDFNLDFISDAQEQIALNYSFKLTTNSEGVPIKDSAGEYGLTITQDRRDIIALQKAKSDKLAQLTELYKTAGTGRITNGKVFYYQAFGDLFKDIQGQYLVSQTEENKAELIVYDILTSVPYSVLATKQQLSGIFPKMKKISVANLKIQRVAMAKINLCTTVQEVNKIYLGIAVKDQSPPISNLNGDNYNLYCVLYPQPDVDGLSLNFTECNPVSILNNLIQEFPL